MRGAGIILGAILALLPAAQATACAIEPLERRIDRLFSGDVVALVELDLLDQREADLSDVMEGWRPEPDEPSVPLLYTVTARVIETLKGPDRDAWTLLWRGGTYPLTGGRTGYIAIVAPGAAVFPDFRERPVETGPDGTPLREILPMADPCNCAQLGYCPAWPLQFDEAEGALVRDGVKGRSE